MLTLGGCAATPDTDGAAAPSSTATDATATDAAAAGNCSGVSVVVDFGALDAPSVPDCVDASASLAAMPPAFACWALWVKADPSADWAYAQEGLGSLQLNAGESVGLVFTTGTETPTPGSSWFGCARALCGRLFCSRWASYCCAWSTGWS